VPATLLQLVNRAQRELSLSAPSTIIGNSTQEVVQLLGLTNAVGYELLREHDWQTLTKEYRTTMVFFTYTGNTTNGSTSVTSMSSIASLTARFMVTGTGIPQDTYVVSASGTTVVLSRAATATGTTVSLTFSQTQYTMPSDYDRLVDQTEWDKTQHWVMLGPETGQQWQWLKSGYISSGPRMRYRLLGGFFQIWPPAGVADYIGFEYLSNQWVLAAADSVTPSKTSFTVDTDTCIFPDTLMVLGIKSKYMMAKGWADPYGLPFERHKAIAIANDAGSPKLSMAPRMSEVLIGFGNIPDSGYGT
jgi:hypothetical protein